MWMTVLPKFNLKYFNNLKCQSNSVFNSCCFLLHYYISYILLSVVLSKGFPGGSVIKNPPANTGDVGSIPASGRSPGKIATHSSILAWRTPRTEESARLQSMGLQKCWTRLSKTATTVLSNLNSCSWSLFILSSKAHRCSSRNRWNYLLIPYCNPLISQFSCQMSTIKVDHGNMQNHYIHNIFFLLLL